MISAVTIVLMLITVVLALCALYKKFLTRSLRKGEPPVVKGHFLWGSAIDFNTHAVDFLHRACKIYGNVFTLRLINQHITIINDPHSYEAVHKEKNFDFDPIQKQVNLNVFSFILKEPRTMIKNTGKTITGTKLGTSMQSYTDNLNYSYEKICKAWNTHKDHTQKLGLRKFASLTIFDAMFNTIFGNSDDHFFNSINTTKNFEIFHKYFNYFWLGVPKAFFPDAMKALGEMIQQPTSDELLTRPDLSEYIRTAVTYMKEKGQTEADIMGHNLVYLHVNYNTFRLAFWVLNNILTDEKAKAALIDELNQAVEQRRHNGDDTVIFNTKDIENLPILDSICQESTRLASGVFMVRYVNEDTMFSDSEGNEFLIRKGDRVALYPPAFHKDPEIFEEPLVFKYDRFVDATFYKNGKELKNPLIAFGSLCPGKRYAILQLKWFIINTMLRFTFALKEAKPAEYATEYHGHEILPPVQDIDVEFHPNEDVPNLVYQ